MPPQLLPLQHAAAWSTMEERTEMPRTRSPLSSSADKIYRFSPEQNDLLQALTLTASSISILAGSLSLYWFLRMRKAFRHQLIMLLIVSNLWRALWYFFPPIVSLSQGPISETSTFCQVSGFMLAYGIEGADFVVLVMAIHAALCIFRTSAVLGESGLYKYRHAIYALWVLLPALAGGLAFINPMGAYVANGAYCYLPIRPFWYRLALSWIPRYMILIAIAILYLSIYLFVQRKFRRTQLSRHTSDIVPSNLVASQTLKSPLGTNVSDAAPSSIGATLVSPTPQEMSSRSDAGRAFPEKGAIHAGVPSWEGYAFGAATPIAKPAQDETITTDLSFVRSSSRLNSEEPRHSSESRESVSNIIEALRDSQHTIDVSQLPIHGGTGTVDPSAPNVRILQEAHVDARHRQIKRQMRFLFVYPVVYFFSWIIPFVQHSLSYRTEYAVDPNFGLTTSATVILALQCTMDSILFTSREKPWRAHDSEDPTSRTFWGSLTPQRFRGHLSTRKSDGTRSSPPPSTHNTNSLTHPSFISSAAHNMSAIFQARNTPRSSSGGRSKGQNVAEARRARERKIAEAALARQVAVDQRRQRKQSLARRGGKDRSWWEQEGRQRKDSVLLGTDSGSGVEKIERVATAPSVRARARSPSVALIMEEREDGLPAGSRSDMEMEMDTGTAMKELGRKASAGTTSPGHRPVVITGGDEDVSALEDPPVAKQIQE